MSKIKEFYNEEITNPVDIDDSEYFYNKEVDCSICEDHGTTKCSYCLEYRDQYGNWYTYNESLQKNIDFFFK